MSWQPYEFNLRQFNEAYDYLVITIENGEVKESRSTCDRYGVTGVRGYGVIYEILEEDGWSRYDEVKEYSSLGGRYRHFFMRKKSAPSGD